MLCTTDRAQDALVANGDLDASVVCAHVTKPFAGSAIFTDTVAVSVYR